MKGPHPPGTNLVAAAKPLLDQGSARWSCRYHDKVFMCLLMDSCCKCLRYPPWRYGQCFCIMHRVVLSNLEPQVTSCIGSACSFLNPLMQLQMCRSVAALASVLLQLTVAVL